MEKWAFNGLRQIVLVERLDFAAVEKFFRRSRALGFLINKKGKAIVILSIMGEKPGGACGGAKAKIFPESLGRRRSTEIGRNPCSVEIERIPGGTCSGTMCDDFHVEVIG